MGGCGDLLIFTRFFWVFGLRDGLIGWGIPVAPFKLLSDDAPQLRYALLLLEVARRRMQSKVSVHWAPRKAYSRNDFA